MRIDVGVLRQMRSKLGITFDRLVADHFTALVDDALAVDLLKIACAQQLEFQRIDPDEFDHCLTGDLLEDAKQALEDACLDFFPDRKKRELHRAALEKGRILLAQAMQEAVQEIAQADPAVVLSQLKRPSSVSPESSGSTPVPTPPPN